MNSSSYDEVSQSDDLSLAPIGTILPYLNKLDPSSGDLLPLPNGWQLCDGSNITKGIHNIWLMEGDFKKEYFYAFRI